MLRVACTVVKLLLLEKFPLYKACLEVPKGSISHTWYRIVFRRFSHTIMLPYILLLYRRDNTQ